MLAKTTSDLVFMLVNLINRNKAEDANRFFELNIKNRPEDVVQIVLNRLGQNAPPIFGDLNNLSDELIDFLVASKFFIASETLRREVNINVFRHFSRREYISVIYFAKPVVFALSDYALDNLAKDDALVFLRIFIKRNKKMTDSQLKSVIDACKKDETIRDEVLYLIESGKLSLCKEKKEALLNEVCQADCF